MKLLVCITRTPETTAKIAFTDSGKAFDSAGVQYIMNPYDEWYALVRALELKEEHGGTVTVINVGSAANDIIIRKALAIGADDAIRVDAEPADAFATASAIAEQVADNGYDIIFTGKETIDYNGSEVPGMLAEILQLPFISYASALDVSDGKVVANRDIEGGVEVVEVPMPLVVSAAKGMAEQRIPNMRGIMMAKRKPLEVVSASGEGARVQGVQFELPPPKSSVHMVDPEDMDELVRLLHEEAKVI